MIPWPCLNYACDFYTFLPAVIAVAISALFFLVLYLSLPKINAKDVKKDKVKLQPTKELNSNGNLCNKKDVNRYKGV